MKYYRGLKLVNHFKSVEDGQYCLACPLFRDDVDSLVEDIYQVVLLQKVGKQARVIYPLDIEVFTSLSSHDRLKEIPEQEFRRNLYRLAGISPEAEICITKNAVERFHWLE